jgi:OOP family OmpA-OmpF porin
VIDSDHDGVVDAQDVCPDTPAKTVVDPRGCPVVLLPEPALTFNLEYLPNAIEVSSAFAVEMQRMTDFVKAHPGRRFFIEGHTDSVGNDADNMSLSLRRAEKIKAYLAEKMGVPASLLEARGFGESNPVADNNTQAGRQQNRRVVIITIPQ